VTATTAHEAPAFIRLSAPITRRFLRFGAPMGPNALLTVRGRRSGRPQTVPLAVAQVDGRGYVVGTFGDTNWVLNLRHTQDAQLTLGSVSTPVRAMELTADQKLVFFGETLPRYLRTLPLHWRLMVRVLLTLAAPAILKDPEVAARSRSVFELVESRSACAARRDEPRSPVGEWRPAGAQHLEKFIVRQRVDGNAVRAGHRVGRQHRVQDGFLRRLDHRVE
jgi:deazaflavin-dependent oxidoreductase (nitroreductase family)